MSTNALRAVLEHIGPAFHRIGACGDSLHAPIGLGSGKRALLISIEKAGPTSVSRLAAMRPVSRQFVQRLVDELLSGGWVETQPNPHHKRSPLIALTTKGRQAILAMQAVEEPYLATLGDGLDPADLAATARILGAICDRITPDILEQIADGGDLVGALEQAHA
jgi:DNA-binding MarR family transcriptional regulator